MRKRIGFGHSLKSLTASTAGHSPQCFSMISISAAGLADDTSTDRGAADSNSGS